MAGICLGAWLRTSALAELVSEVQIHSTGENAEDHYGDPIRLDSEHIKVWIVLEKRTSSFASHRSCRRSKSIPLPHHWAPSALLGNEQRRRS